MSNYAHVTAALDAMNPSPLLDERRSSLEREERIRLAIADIDDELQQVHSELRDRDFDANYSKELALATLGEGDEPASKIQLEQRRDELLARKRGLMSAHREADDYHMRFRSARTNLLCEATRELADELMAQAVEMLVGLRRMHATTDALRGAVPSLDGLHREIDELLSHAHNFRSLASREPIGPDPALIEAVLEHPNVSRLIRPAR
ncbi:hypothetical protein [Sphingobium sp. CR28]|uniref:hypothetical protein n=1 Tax=Sphingobium sp. CR28 TaxID=3400272 RepID=UPI003FEF6198